jgi:transcriptional regulator with XRE-family HTH domain
MSPRDAHNLARSIRHHREAAGLSINALARAAGLPPSTVLRFEAGEYEAPDPDKLERLAGALGVDSEEFFAHYPAPERLPDFAPYLRAKFGMSKDAVAEAEQFFAELEAREKRKKGPKKGGRRGNRAR